MSRPTDPKMQKALDLVDGGKLAVAAAREAGVDFGQLKARLYNRAYREKLKADDVFAARQSGRDSVKMAGLAMLKVHVDAAMRLIDANYSVRAAAQKLKGKVK